MAGGDAGSWWEMGEGCWRETSSDAPIFARSYGSGELSVKSGHVSEVVFREKKCLRNAVVRIKKHSL